MNSEFWSSTRGRQNTSGVPDAKLWGPAAHVVSQSERVHSTMCTLANDIDVCGADLSGPVVVERIVSRLAGAGLTISDIVCSLSGKLDWTLIDADHTLEVAEAFTKARRAFAEACEAGQAATKVMRDHTQIPS